MTKAIIGIAGLILLVASIHFGVKVTRSEKLAALGDDQKTFYGMIEGETLPCSWEAVPPERVLSENKSQAVVANVTGIVDLDCESIISLHAPGFDISPQKEEQTISLQRNTSGSMSWIITPRKSGSYQISISDSLNTKIFGITVTDMFGLTAMQAKTASLGGGLFGPMLTIPWWAERLLRRRKSKEDPKEVNS